MIVVGGVKTEVSEDFRMSFRTHGFVERQPIGGETVRCRASAFWASGTA